MDPRYQMAPVGLSPDSTALYTVGLSSCSAGWFEVSNAILKSFSHKFTLTFLAWKIMRPSGSSALPVQTGLLAMLALATSALGDPAQGDGKKSPGPVQSPYAVVNHIGEADQQVTFKDGKLLAHRRSNDPFGIAIGGKFKGLPPVAEHSPVTTNSSVQSNKPVAADQLTLEKAVQQLPIGGVNIADREALIGYRSVHEGDLLVLELSGHQFVVWVQSIDRRGVQFCDINLQQHAVKPFRFGPSELPGNTTARQVDVRDFLKQDGN
jgi:hypothetical protein